MKNKPHMKSNPGGSISPENAIGRELLVSQIWEILANQSIYINAERRIGKTTVLSILNAYPHENWLPVKRDLENICSADEFAAAVYQDVEAFLKPQQRIARHTKAFLESIRGVTIGSILKMPDGKPVPWKTLLEKAIQDLDEAFKHEGQRVLFLWDEMPLMLQNVRDREGEINAMEVLDMLRYLRQTYPDSLRMVLTGSIGLHHVLSSLKDSGYANAPTNDLVDPGIVPLSLENGKKLASHLLRGEGIISPNLDEAAISLAEQVDCFPYYIHHLVQRLKFDNQEATPAIIETLLQSQLVDRNDPWELQHYRGRITTYYGKNEPLVLVILDALAVTDAPLSQNKLFEEINSVGIFREKEEIRKVFGLLERDHYISRDQSGCYHFTFGLIQRWWRLDRGLES